ncbi:hypothetical protein GRF29_19g258856 [Pseudopithomyces chartarum]|uniref:Uncharacterized protein n=1 Tax=Pseudopithomyces chartarum TaxID=1892770 RepID=A0AAN6M394_9PLEO|nr:hypothetical protein GRF29_19g258856 [Pseudopithomyces chartarum]
MSKNIFITGANRGLGLGLLEKYAQKDNHVIVAAVRDPQSESARRLADVATGEGTKIVVVKIDSAIHEDAISAVEKIQKDGISHLDVVIANAGISSIWPLIKDAKIEDIDAHMRTNVYGVVSLYQATRELLKASVELGKEPAFVLMGSMAGMIADQPPIPNSAYGPSKAAAHWFIIRMHAEDSWLNAFVMDPGSRLEE